MKTLKLLLTIAIISLISFKGATQGTLEDYRRAEKFIHFNVEDLVYNLAVSPNWNDANSFWFKQESAEGYRFILYDINKEKQKEAFNHEALAEALEEEKGGKINPDSLPFRKIKFLEQGEKVEFQLDSTIYTCKLSNYKLTPRPAKKDTLSNNESLSPDGKWLALVQDYNLYLRSMESGEVFQLTDDGIDHYDYATPLSWYKVVDESKGDSYDPTINVIWSPDSKKLVTYRLDRRNAKKLYLYQSLPEEGMRAKVWSYERALPGENSVKKVKYFVFDMEDKSKMPLDIPPYADILTSIAPSWHHGSDSLYLARFTRGYKSIDFFLFDAHTGESKNLVREEAETMVEYQTIQHHLTKDGKHLIWASERDGWNHLYLIDAERGKVVRQLTKGNYVVRNIVHVDEEKGVIWFIAGGKEKGRDPYYRHLYRVNFDGKDLQLLTPEDAEHDIRFSAEKGVFVDNYSRIDKKPVSILRDAWSGRLIDTLQEANIDELLALGWKAPKRFEALARDGKTPIYGAIFYPSNFDPDKKYPVIDATYSGPQAVRTPKSFARGYRNADQPFAELGFIVVTIDGMGTAWRSKAFHDVSYKNLGDIGAPDHIAALNQLTERYDFLDLDRVGIYGHSAGGYDAAHALLTHPKFYKVGIASAGNHDHGMAKAWWPEQYMGMPGDHYQEQSNLNLAENLEGDLLLITGDMDNNVNPASTFRFAAELVNANKDFELLIIPNANHGGLYSHPYFIRKRWDFFVKHLMDREPPKNYQIKK